MLRPNDGKGDARLVDAALRRVSPKDSGMHQADHAANAVHRRTSYIARTIATSAPHEARETAT